jgi:hypothetical protein
MVSFALPHISLVLVFVAAVVNNVLMMIWYSPSFFGRRWQQLSGVKMDTHDVGWDVMAQSFLISLVQAYALAWILEGMGALTTYDALVVAASLVIFLYGSGAATALLWERRSLELAFINVGALLVCFSAMAIIFAYGAV